MVGVDVAMYLFSKAAVISSTYVKELMRLPLTLIDTQVQWIIVRFPC